MTHSRTEVVDFSPQGLASLLCTKIPPTCETLTRVQVIKDVELQKPVKIVFQKDAGGSAQRWVEITVDEQTTPAAADPPGPRQQGGKKLPPR